MGFAVTRRVLFKKQHLWDYDYLRGCFWLRVEPKSFIVLLALSKLHLAAIVGVLTVSNLQACGEAQNFNGCYLEEDKVETLRPFLHDCLVFARLRLKHFRCRTFIELSERIGNELRSEN